MVFNQFAYFQGVSLLLGLRFSISQTGISARTLTRTQVSTNEKNKRKPHESNSILFRRVPKSTAKQRRAVELLKCRI